MSIDSVKQDSLSLPSVEILAKQLMINEKPDVLLEQSSIALINGFSLTEVLNEEANIYMRNYGPGTAATISMRGSGPSQTQLS